MKKQQTCLEHYGVEFPMQSDVVKRHAAQTCLDKYGAECYFQSDDYKHKAHKKYLFDGIYFCSIPEIAFYIYHNDNGIEVEYQPDVELLYLHDGKMHRYEPDFKIGDQLFELKGRQFVKSDGTWQNPYDHAQDALYEAKHQCCIQNNVKILYTLDYMPYVEYVFYNYGKHFFEPLRANK